MDWLESLALGAVQGLTEFLPISSDGHLKITADLFRLATGKPQKAGEEIFFIVMLHIGTLLAIVLHYRQQVIEGARGLLGSDEVATDFKRPGVIRIGILAIIATLPLIPDKLIFMPLIEEAFKSMTWTGAGFLVTAAILLVTIWLPGGDEGPRETTWWHALLVGLAQMFAPLPGVSRSGLTISSALALGFSRTWAVNFSLLIAVPAILGATVFEIKKVDPKILTGERVAQIVAASALAGVIGYLAIVWLVRLVRSGRVWYFSVYLVVLGLGLIAVDQLKGGSTDASPSKAPVAPDRPALRQPDRPGDRASLQPGRSSALARPIVDGSRSGQATPRPPETLKVGTNTRLVLG